MSAEPIVVKVATDAEGRMDPNALIEALARDAPHCLIGALYRAHRETVDEYMRALRTVLDGSESRQAGGAEGVSVAALAQAIAQAMAANPLTVQLDTAGLRALLPTGSVTEVLEREAGGAIKRTGTAHVYPEAR